MIALPIACQPDGDRMRNDRETDGLLLEGKSISLFPGLSTVLTPPDPFGPEMIVNGDFATDTVWTKGAGFSIAGGRAIRIVDASTSGLSQPVAFVAGRSYQLVFTVLNFVSGQFLPRFTGGTNRNGSLRTANGTYTETLLANAGNITIQFFASATTLADIDNVSIREVL